MPLSAAFVITAPLFCNQGLELLSFFCADERADLFFRRGARAGRCSSRCAGVSFAEFGGLGMSCFLQLRDLLICKLQTALEQTRGGLACQKRVEHRQGQRLSAGNFFTDRSW